MKAPLVIFLIIRIRSDLTVILVWLMQWLPAEHRRGPSFCSTVSDALITESALTKNLVIIPRDSSSRNLNLRTIPLFVVAETLRHTTHCVVDSGRSQDQQFHIFQLDSKYLIVVYSG